MDARRIPFTPQDEEHIASAGVWGMIVAIASMASAVLSTVSVGVIAARAPHARVVLSTMLVPGLISLGIAVLLGVWLLQASLAFRKVALTDEADQHHLLVGFGKLRNYFMTIGIILIIMVCAMVLVFCGALTCGAALR